MGKNILIIDDDPDVILYLETILRDHGYQTVAARNGLEGLEKTKSENPDLVLLDLMMPHKSGISLLAELKGDERLKGIPVIMVTGVAGETGIDLEAFLKRSSGKEGERHALNPEGYVEKPVDPEKLLELVSKLMDR